jgi:lactoylglutathione lyase
MNIKRVGNVILTVTDLGKSVEFYNKILGMPIKRERNNWVDLGQTGALLSLHPTSDTDGDSSIDNRILIGFVVGDVSSAIDELKLKNIKIHRDIQDKSSGKNAILLDPDGYMISLFEPNFSAEKTIQSGGYIGFTPV